MTSWRAARVSLWLIPWTLAVLLMVVLYLRRPRSKVRSLPLVDSSFRYAPGMLEAQLAWLGPAQLRRYYDIRRESISRDEVEIVLSVCEEDYSWSDMYSSIRTVYDKGARGAAELPRVGSKAVRKLPNVGRESHTILTHIVENYHRLANLTVFSQGSPPTRGYRSQGTVIGRGHMLSNSTFHDFVLTTSDHGHFVFTAAAWLPTLAQRIRRGYNLGVLDRIQGQSKCPSPRLDSPLGTEYKFELEDDPSGLLAHIARRCDADPSLRSFCSGAGFWNEYVGSQRPPHDVVFFAQGAVFAATRPQILKRSLDYYKRLLAAVSSSSDPAAGYFLEYFWYYVLTSDLSPCPVNGKEFDWVESVTFENLAERATFSKSRPLSKDEVKRKIKTRKQFY